MKLIKYKPMILLLPYYMIKCYIRRYKFIKMEFNRHIFCKDYTRFGIDFDMNGSDIVGYIVVHFFKHKLTISYIKT